jgi:hypothetical protein
LSPKPLRPPADGSCTLFAFEVMLIVSSMADDSPTLGLIVAFIFSSYKNWSFYGIVITDSKSSSRTLRPASKLTA